LLFAATMLYIHTPVKKLLEHDWLKEDTEVGSDNLPALQKHKSAHHLLTNLGKPLKTL
jgi:hypothetical protein